MMKGDIVLMKQVIQQASHRLSANRYWNAISLLLLLLLVLFLVTACHHGL